jgi:cell wall-associated NlpC family hydrolase
MNYGIAHISIIPMREEANDRAEMVNQILFGEHYKVIEKRAKWLKVRLNHDAYEGWICRKQHLEITKSHFLRLSEEIQHYNYNLIDAQMTANGEMIPIGLGSCLPLYDGEYCLVNSAKFQFEGGHKPSLIHTKKDIVDTGFMYLHAPYLWGGRTPMGIDCSGLTQMAYRLNGRAIPRDASQQIKLGSTLSFIEEAEPGDLAFFDDAEGAIVHVGIILENNQILHASGKVRIDSIDQQGIFNKDLGEHTHKLRLIKQLF